MSAQGLQQCLEGDMRNAQRTMILDFDLNSPPPDESPDGISVHVNSGDGQAEVHGLLQHQTRNDVEVIDDDVAIIAPRVYAEVCLIKKRICAEARRNSQKSHAHALFINGLKIALDEAEGVLTSLLEHTTWNNKRKRTVPDEKILNAELYMIPEASNKNKEKNTSMPLDLARNVPLPEAATFSCPICMGQLSESTSTKCGHIFCKECISTAIATQGKCPTCRQKLTKRSTFRVYLPAIN